MRKIIFGFSLLLFLFGLTNNGFGNNDFKIDSLLSVIKTAQEDTNKVKELHTASSYYLKTDQAKSLDYAQQTVSLALKLGFLKYVILGYMDISYYYYSQSDYIHSKEYTLKTFPIIQRTHKKAPLSEVYLNLSVLAERVSDYSKAMLYSDSAYTIASEFKDSSLISKIMGRRGNLYIDLSDYPMALSCLLDALKLNLKTNDKWQTSKNYLNLGNYYTVQKGYDKALDYYRRSLSLAAYLNDKPGAGACFEKIGEIYQIRENWDSALNYYNRSLVINKEIGSISTIAICDCGIGVIYSEQGKFSEAIHYLSLSVAISQKTGDKNSLSAFYAYLGDIYKKKKDYKKGIEYMKKSLAIGKVIKQKYNECVNYLNLADCYESLKDFSTANYYLRQNDKLRDSIFNETTIKKTAEMEARFSLDKKEKEIALLTKDKEFQQQKLSFLHNFIVCSFLLITLLFFFVYRYYHTRQLLKLQMLRTKIASDLHDDIGSTLSSISMFSQITRQQSGEVVPLLDQIGEYSRKMLDSMADIVWTINPENDNFEKIILRMRSFAFEMLGAKNVDFDFSADEAVAQMKLSMIARKNLYLIFKEATNNMVKYADANSAFFSITGTKNNLIMLIRDNGKGFDINQETQGNGLKNMKNRAMEIGAKFLIESEPGKGTTIQLLIKTA